MRGNRTLRNKRRKHRRLIILIIIVITLAIGGMRYKSQILNFAGKIYNNITDSTEDIGDIERIPENGDKPNKKAGGEGRTSQLSLLSVGDIMFHQPQIKAAYIGRGNYDFSPPFEYVEKY